MIYLIAKAVISTILIVAVSETAKRNPGFGAIHFLTGADDHAAYRERLARAVALDGMAIIATFSPSGPEKCSGLPVQRYDVAGLEAEFRSELELIDDWREIHRTPWGSDQPFNWCLFKRR